MGYLDEENYFKELAHEIVRIGKSDICRAVSQTGSSGWS